jgi:2-phosphosulfolactate phosphatase
MAPDPHAQEGFRRRFDWGRGGARGLARHVDVAVVVDVLSFSTSVDVAVARSCEVVPVAWGERRSAGLSADEAGVLAVGRRATSPEHPYSLSPASLRSIPQGTRLVLPSPNGATICAELAGSGVLVLVGCLRNAASVARFAAETGGTVGVIAAGERWPDGSLRPALEDIAGAAAILGALPGPASPEVDAAIAAGTSAATRRLEQCASARELIQAGFAEDVALALESDVSACVPLMHDGVLADVAR